MVVIPSSCGIFVYKLVTSIETRIAFCGTLVPSMKLINCVASLMYDCCSFIIGWRRVSTKAEILWVGESHPVYVPDSVLYTLKFVQHTHEVTLHGGVALTMAKVRETHWIPRLHKLVKRVIKQCYRCQRFQITAFANPPQGNLLRDRTEGNSPFQVVGVDYAGPIKYRTSLRL